ncbi:Hypothetical protein D9617_2g056610 [Elsinoe fawcettii]|nr:Hypothetical protein D9617_2g056610 [Elsinoe fawcettii]
MYARQTLQAIGPGRPCFRVLIRQCRRQRPVRFYSDARDGDSSRSADDPASKPGGDRPGQLSRRNEVLDRRTRRSAANEADTWGIKAQEDDGISPEVERERTALREAATKAASAADSPERGQQAVQTQSQDNIPVLAADSVIEGLPGQSDLDSIDELSDSISGSNSQFTYEEVDGTQSMRHFSELDNLDLEPQEIAALKADPRAHIVLADDEGGHAVARVDPDEIDDTDINAIDAQPSPGTLELGLAPDDLAKYRSGPELYLLISSPDGPLLRPRSDLNKLGLSPDEKEAFLSNPSAFLIAQNDEGVHTVVPYNSISSNDLQSFENTPQSSSGSGISVTPSTDAEDEETDASNTLQRDLHDLEMYDKHDITPIPFSPAESSKQHYLHAGRGNATIAAANFEGVVQDRIKALTDKRQNDFRYAPDIAARMMRGGLVSFESAKERDEVNAAAQDYAYSLNRSASKARKGKDEVGEHDFAPLDEHMQNSILSRHVRGRYWDMDKKRYKSNVLNHVSAAVTKNNTYLGRDSAVFLKKVQGLVTPPARQGGQKQARK